jgi:hypothetical protein
VQRCRDEGIVPPAPASALPDKKRERLNWVREEWGSRPHRRQQIDGTVIRFEKGDWPRYLRLISGHPSGLDSKNRLYG